MTALDKRLRQMFGNNAMGIAAYMFQCAQLNQNERAIRKWLKKTGDKNFTADTFIKAAKLILEVQ